MTITLVFLLAVLQLADGYTTVRIIRQGGEELNPLMRKAFERFGMKLTLIVKGIGVTALGYFISTVSVELLVLLCVFYGVIVGRNYREMRK